MSVDCIIDIVAQGAWNGGVPVDNSIYENRGMQFKGGIPVNHKTIEDRIGVRTRIAAPADERIGVIALKDLLSKNDIDPARVKVLISATNIGEDKIDRGPCVRFPFAEIGELDPQAIAFDLYAGCPGFNVAVESAFMLSQAGGLAPGDLTVIVGAENIHRAKAFKPLDTANIIFGDDAMATVLETHGAPQKSLPVDEGERVHFSAGARFVDEIADRLFAQNPKAPPDGIIIDNQLGKLEYRVPASAARVQHALVERIFSEATAQGLFGNFREALKLYDRQVRGFAFDIMTLENNPQQVQQLAAAYAASGRYPQVAAIHIAPDGKAVMSVKRGVGQPLPPPRRGIIDTLTRTHGCFAGYIEAIREKSGVYGYIDGKGVFLHATRGARNHIETLLGRNDLTIDDIELMVEHQANFAMIPLTLEQVIGPDRPDVKRLAADFLADKMVTNVHLRGNCSVVCMQRLPYDLNRGVLEPDTIQDFSVNRNVENLKGSSLILYDSVGAGMTRSSFLRRR